MFSAVHLVLLTNHYQLRNNDIDDCHLVVNMLICWYLLLVIKQLEHEPMIKICFY